MPRILAMILAMGLVLASGTGLLAYGPFEEKEKMRERMEILRMWKMMEALDLDRDTANKMMQIRQEFLRQRKELRREIRKEFQELRAIVQSPEQAAEDGKLKELLEGIRGKRAKLKKLWEEQYDEVSKILTLRQQAKLMVFLKDFHREVREALRGFRHGPQHGKGRMHRHGPNPAFRGPDERRSGPGPGSPEGPSPEAESGPMPPQN